MLTVMWGYMPTEVRTAFRPILVQYLWLVPSWCLSLHVAYDADTGGGFDIVASCGAEPEYRQGRIRLHAGWIDSSPATRRRAVVHELLHLPLTPLVKEHEEQVDRLFADGDAPRFRAHLREQGRQRMEGAVQDLTYAVLSFPVSGLPIVTFREEEDEHPPEPGGSEAWG